MFRRSKKIRDSLTKTRRSFFGQISGLLGPGEITEETWEDLEALLVQADVGVNTTIVVVDALREQVLKHFRHNLPRMIDIADSVGAKVVLIAPAASLSGISPFKSENRDDLAGEALRLADEAVELAEQIGYPVVVKLNSETMKMVIFLIPAIIIKPFLMFTKPGSGTHTGKSNYIMFVRVDKITQTSMRFTSLTWKIKYM